MLKFDLDVNLTNKYNPGWDYLDNWQTIGQYGILKNHGNTLRIKVFSHAKETDIIRALYSNFNQGCRCVYDCCGHWQT